jgi:myosin-1
VIDAYRGRLPYEVAPHTFAIAEDAYSSLLRYQRPQSIVVSGESGAGKTEACRQILTFVARVSGAYAQRSKGAAAGKPTAADAHVSTALRVKDRLVTSNVCLEAFGNAQTLRNDNSSRFGKLMEVYFRGSGVACGGDVKVYLLEKNRVVWQGDGERNFHVLHQLAAGASAEQRRSLRLGTPEKYAYLSRDNRKIAGINDAAVFKGLCQCLGILGVGAEDQAAMWRVLAVILHLGNLDFTSENERTARGGGAGSGDEEGDSGGTDGGSGGAGGSTGATGSLNAHAACAVRDGDSGEALAALAALLGVEEAVVEAAMSHRTITVGGADTSTLQSVPQARASRDSLAKAIYERLFNYVVKRINDSIAVAAAGSPRPAAAAAASTGEAGDAGAEAEEAAAAAAPVDDTNKQLSMAILDIYGFESLGHNGFEQLCINYCNEKLQQLFIQATLKMEQEEYAAEGIAWTPIDYFDNQVVVGLVEGKPGVFTLLDDACAVADAGEDKVLAGLNAKLSKHAHYVAPKIANGTFTIKHYAGDVGYHVGGMIAANRDTLHNDLIKLMAAAGAGGSPLLGELFEDKRSAEEVGGSAPGAGGGGVLLLTRPCSLLTIHPPAAPALPAAPILRVTVQKKRRPPTTGTQFKASVGALIDTLSSCMPHYIRCVKPNDSKAPMKVDDDRFLHQVRCVGAADDGTVDGAMALGGAGLLMRLPTRWAATHTIPAPCTTPSSRPPQLPGPGGERAREARGLRLPLAVRRLPAPLPHAERHHVAAQGRGARDCGEGLPGRYLRDGEAQELHHGRGHAAGRRRQRRRRCGRRQWRRSCRPAGGRRAARGLWRRGRRAARRPRHGRSRQRHARHEPPARVGRRCRQQAAACHHWWRGQRRGRHHAELVHAAG